MGEFIEDASHTISKIGHCDVRMGAPWIEKLQILCGEGKREIGVNDKDGRPIFEGDRVRSEFRGKVGTIVYRPGRFVLRHDDGIEMTFLDENSSGLQIQEARPKQPADRREND